jgi:uncharacterized protein YprB with RNaseH-like and TPR domain
MKVLVFDTESTDLAASWGRILCASFVEISEDSEPYTFRGDKRPWKGSELIDDSKLVVAIRDELEAADMIVGWNSILHDQPLLNARLALAGERPLLLGEKHGTRHLDAMYYAGGQSMKIGGRKLDTVAKFFKSPNQKTPLDGLTWQRAATGDKGAMDSVVEHCEFDVLVLRDLWPQLACHVKKFQFSLSEVWPFIQHIPSHRKKVNV